MKTITEIKNVHFKKLNQVSVQYGENRDSLSQTITNKKFVCKIGQHNRQYYRVVSTYVPNSYYREYPLVQIDIQRNNFFGRLKTEKWYSIDTIQDEHIEEITSYMHIMRDYWNDYLAFKGKPKALFFAEFKSDSASLPIYQSALGFDYELEDIQPVYQNFSRMNSVLVSQIPDDLIEEGKAYRQAKDVLKEFIGKQKLISLYGAKVNLLVQPLSMDFAGLFFSINLTSEFGKIVVQHHDHNDVLNADIEELDRYFDELLKKNKTVHLFNPPNQYFIKLLDKLDVDTKMISEHSINQQFSRLEEKLGSWQEVELLSRELSQIVAKNQDEEVYKLYDYLKKQGITIDRIPFKGMYYFAVKYEFNNKERRKEIEFFMSNEELPSNINELAESFFKTTLY